MSTDQTRSRSQSETQAPSKPSLIARARHQLGIGGLIAAVIAVLMLSLALLAPLLAPYGPLNGSLLEAHQVPSGAHLLGTDQAGRDLLSRLLYGARSSLVGPVLVVVLTAFMGSTLALVAAWNGGWVDAAIGRLLDLLFAFPSLLLAIIVVAIFGGGLFQAGIALSVAYTPYTARVLRSVAIRERVLGYIESARLQGRSGIVVVIKHLLPNVFPQIATGAAINFGYAMIELAAISFLGMGVQPPAADWGLMVANGQDSLVQGYPQQSLYAGACIVIAVVCFGIIGERLGGRRAGGRA